MSSDTPRTNELHRKLVRRSEGPDWIAGTDYCDMIDHARQLERELAAMIVEVERMTACNRELREATDAMDDPAINNTISLPDAVRALRQRVEELTAQVERYRDSWLYVSDLQGAVLYRVEELEALLREARDDVGECLNNVLPHAGWERYDRRIADYKDRLERIDRALDKAPPAMDGDECPDCGALPRDGVRTHRPDCPRTQR